MFISVLSHIDAEWLPTLVRMPVIAFGCHMVAGSYLLSPAVSEHNQFLVLRTCLFSTPDVSRCYLTMAWHTCSHIPAVSQH